MARLEDALLQLRGPLVLGVSLRAVPRSRTMGSWTANACFLVTDGEGRSDQADALASLQRFR